MAIKERLVAADAYACTCSAGFAGVNCADNVLECASTPCQNNGTCSMPLYRYRYQCACKDGFEGHDCEYDTYDECSSDPCQNVSSVLLCEPLSLSVNECVCLGRDLLRPAARLPLRMRAALCTGNVRFGPQLRPSVWSGGLH